MLIKINTNNVNQTVYSILDYLELLINFSIVNIDIKSFLLFLYLHDTKKDLICNNEYYKKWLYDITYNYAYEINKFSIKDLEHYKDNIVDPIDSKVLLYLENNIIFDPIKNTFLKKN